MGHTGARWLAWNGASGYLSKDFLLELFLVRGGITDLRCGDLAAMPLHNLFIRIGLVKEVVSQSSLDRGVPCGFHRLSAILALSQHLRRVRPVVDCSLLQRPLKGGVPLSECTNCTAGVYVWINRLLLWLGRALLCLNKLLDLALVRLTLFAFVQQHMQWNLRLRRRRRCNGLLHDWRWRMNHLGWIDNRLCLGCGVLCLRMQKGLDIRGQCLLLLRLHLLIHCSFSSIVGEPYEPPCIVGRDGPL